MKKKDEKNQNKSNGIPKKKTAVNAKTIAFVGLFGALSAVLMLFRFPLPFMPPFMEFDLSGVAEMIGAMILGPVSAAFIIVIKMLLKLLMNGSSTVGTGELSAMILSFCYVMPALLVYYHKKTKTTAKIGLAVGTMFTAVAAVFTNIFMIIPFYIKVLGLTMDKIIAMCGAANPLMKDTFTMAVFGILPFNLIKYGISSLITYLIYKKVSKAVKGIITH